MGRDMTTIAAFSSRVAQRRPRLPPATRIARPEQLVETRGALADLPALQRSRGHGRRVRILTDGAAGAATTGS